MKIKSLLHVFPHKRKSHHKKNKVTTLHQSIIPSEEGAFSKTLKNKYKTETSFYVKNTSPVESIMAQIQVSMDGKSFFNEGYSISIPSNHSTALSTKVLSKKIRLVIYGALVYDPVQVSIVFMNRH